MRNNLDTSFLTALGNETARPVLYVDMQLSTSLRYSTLDVDYYYESNLYLPREIELETVISQSGLSVDRADLMVENANRELSAVLLSGNEKGKPVILNVGAIDDDGVLLGGGVFFYGILNNYEIADDICQLFLVNELVRWKKKPLRKTNALCPWPYGGDECGHSGSWCDQTYDRCSDLSNTAQFGGEMYLADLQEKEIWWGRIPR